MPSVNKFGTTTVLEVQQCFCLSSGIQAEQLAADTGLGSCMFTSLLMFFFLLYLPKKKEDCFKVGQKPDWTVGDSNGRSQLAGQTSRKHGNAYSFCTVCWKHSDHTDWSRFFEGGSATFTLFRTARWFHFLFFATPPFCFSFWSLPSLHLLPLYPSPARREEVKSPPAPLRLCFLSLPEAF